MVASRASKASKQAVPKPDGLPRTCFVLDNGAFTMKAGFAPTAQRESGLEDESSESRYASCYVIPNAIVKSRSNQVFIGAQSTTITDWNLAQARRPLEKGYVVNWESEREIWEHSFFDDKTARKELRIADPAQTTLILGEAPNTTTKLQNNTDEMIMEEWGFGGYTRCVAPSLNAWNPSELRKTFGDDVQYRPMDPSEPAECILVVDSGYSQTTVTPLYNGRPLQRAVRRLEIGGKHLTNYLKEIVSLRQFHMLDETYIMSDVKEAVSFVSCDFAEDMERAHEKPRRMRGSTTEEQIPTSGIVVDYILPNPTASTASHRQGFVRPHDPEAALRKKKRLLSGLKDDIDEDILTLSNERFTVPELLFSPSDIGMKQAGIHEIIMESLSVLPTGLHPTLLANILVVGGTSQMSGFAERLEKELRMLAPASCIVRVRRAEDPIRSSWLGGTHLAQNHDALRSVSITRQEYQEHGPGWAARKFAGADLG